MSEREQLEQAIAALEAQRALLGAAVVDAALAPMREKLAALPALPPTGQRKLLTVLFADIAGYTALAEARDAEEVRDLLDALRARLDAVLVAHGATIDKHIGDAVMALFGTPTAREDDPERALRAALALHEALARAAADLAPGGGASPPPLRLRVGISTGPVLLGAVGTVGEVTALGDTVNLARRLEEAAPVGGILVAHDTYRHVRGLFDVRELPPLALKGKAQPVHAYLVERAKPRGFHLSARGIAGLETPLVGRAAELRRLQETLEAVLEEGTAQALTVVGEAGVGKSRLLSEFEGWLDLQPARVWFFKGRARAETHSLPYALVRDLLAYRFGIAGSDSAATARARLEAGVRGFLGDEAAEVAPLLGQLVGLDFAGHPTLHGLLEDPRALRERAFAAATRLITLPARQSPVVLLLEDLQWADDGSLDLLDHVVRAARAAPLLAVYLTRPVLFERRPSWGEGQEAHRRLTLEPLSRREARRLAGALLGKLPAVPEELVELVVGHAEGNPFYVEETVQMLIDDGVLVPGAEAWALRAERLAEVRVPATLTGVLQARLDGLPPAERETLQRAAVVGRVFWDEVVTRLEAVAGGVDGVTPPEALAGGTRARLDQARARELVYRREAAQFAGTAEYLFKHALLRDVAYESVLKRQRRVYHGVVAAWLEERGGERATEVAGLIAEHYARAGEDGAAGRWYARAGDQARATDAPEAAITAYEQALALLPGAEAGADSGAETGADSGAEAGADAATRLAVYEGLGDVLERQARPGEARAAYEAMRRLAVAARDGAAEARAWLGVALTQEHQGDFAAERASAERAEAAAGTAGAARERAQALYRQGWALYRQGQLAPARERAEAALQVAEAQDARGETAESLRLLGTVQVRLGQFTPAERALERALRLARELGDRRLVGTLVSNLSGAAAERGEMRTAVAHMEESLAIAQEIGDRHRIIINLLNRGDYRSTLGEYEAAERDLRQAVALCREAGVTNFLAHATCYLARALLGQGRVNAARVEARRALRLAGEMGELYVVGVAWRVLGQAARVPAPTVAVDGAVEEAADEEDEEAADGAEACFAESLRVLREAGIEAESARTLRAWAEELGTRGERGRAAALWREARDIFARLGLDNELASIGERSGDGDDPADAAEA